MRKKIRVLQVLTLNQNGGVASLVMNLYRHIDRQQIQFDFLTWVVDESLPTYDEEIKRLGGIIYTVPYYKKNFTGFIKEINNIFKLNYISILHCHESLASIPILYLGKQHHIPVRIAHSHNPKIDGLFKSILVKLSHPLFKYIVTHYFSCTQKAGEFLFGKNVTLYIVNNGIDYKKFYYDSKIRSDTRLKLQIQNKLVIGFVGRLVQQKNPLYLLEVLAELYKQNKNCVLLVIGEGDLKQQLFDQAKEWNLTDQIIFLGSRSDMNELMNAMDVFVLPSLYEGFGIVLLEAQATGLSCVTSDCVPPETQISDSIYYLSLKLPSRIWAEKILSAMNNKREYDYHLLNQDAFDINKTAEKLMTFYQDVQEPKKF